MDIKPKPNHKIYLEILRRMTPEQKLNKVFELSTFSKELFIQGVKQSFPELSEEELKEFIRKRLDKCHNRNY